MAPKRRNKQTPNPKTPSKGKRCEARAFELIYDLPDTYDDQEAICNALCKKTFGVYKLASAIHKKRGHFPHIHIAVILRDEPKTLYWSGLKKYFTVKVSEQLELDPKEHGLLKNKSRCFDRKIQQYYDYFMDQSKHVNEEIIGPFLWKWKPMSEMEKQRPADFIFGKIRAGLTLDGLDDLIDDTATPDKLCKEALFNYEKYEKAIGKLEEIRETKRQAALYKEKVKGYRPFQLGLKGVLDGQNDRNIHCHYDPGLTGKNHFVDIESMRPDTLVLQSAETKRIAYAWNPKKHRRIIFDIPAGAMEFVNTSVIEKLKNGTLFSGMHHPKMKKSPFKPSIILLGNEEVPNTWTEDRLTRSTTNRNSYEFISL